MTKINQEEYEVLKKDLKEGYKWITRDKSGSLYTHEDKVVKATESWLSRCFKPLDSSNLFQFIQWEDEEPHSIADLIEEYESELFKNIRTVNIDVDKITGSVHQFKDFDESEETEVKKDIEWLQDSITFVMQGLFSTPNPNYFDFEKANKRMRELVNQLDEPEVLSQKWIDDNKKYGGVHDIGYYVPIGRLYDLLVPKKELPVVPQWVANNIESKKRVGTRLNVAMSEFPEFKLEKELDIDEHECNEIYARAWLDGYTVEEEPKYRARLKVITDEFIASYLRTQSSDAEDRLKALEIGSKYIHEDYRHLSEFTEDELKRLDIWDSEQWEVEEVEE